MARYSNMLQNGNLVAYPAWGTYIDSLKTQETISDEKKAASLIAPLIENAIKKRIPKERFGIFFSGGVDSSTIAYLCRKYTDDFICYTVGIDGSRDLAYSEIVAKEFNLNHVKKVLTLQELEKIFSKTSKILGKDLMNIVNLGVGSVVVAAIELAKKDNIRLFFSGIGSEEIFAGYQRHEKTEDINMECWEGLKSMWSRDFLRDSSIANHEKVEFLTPFLDPDLIKSSMKISGDLKIKDDIKKYILRVASETLGMPHEIAFRPKIAAQYGSSFDKAISRIARSKGYKLKKQYLDYLKSEI